MKNMNKKKGVIDRIEDGEVALITINNEEKKLDLPLFLLPDGVKEGDWLDIEYLNDEIINININEKETEKALNRIKEKFERLRKNNDK
jgi:hypothetical protein